MVLTVEVYVRVEDTRVTLRPGIVCVRQVYMIWAAARVRLYISILYTYAYRCQPAGCCFCHNEELSHVDYGKGYYISQCAIAIFITLLID